MLITGYYEPRIRGSRISNPDYPYPIFGRPRDLIAAKSKLTPQRQKSEPKIGRLQGGGIVPYHDRREIETKGILLGKAPVVAWARDLLDVYFLHIQGGGKIIMETSETLTLSYDTHNGHPYRSIGRLLIREGKIAQDRMSMQTIQDYLKQNPNEILRVTGHNPRYIFFRPDRDGPRGSLNVTLTPYRSIALDHKIFPPALPVYVITQIPQVDDTGRIQAWSDYRLFAVNQDTGGAITGPGRADIFCGDGLQAEVTAGHLRHPGTLYVLVLRPDSIRPE